LDEIRAQERWENVLIVVMTADIAMAKALDKKADLSLLKPISVARIQDIGEKITAELLHE
jgi:CheY-like chemotaxis protein